MKTINKIGALLLASVLLAACAKDDVKVNSAEAKVGLQKTEFSFKENLNLIEIPVVVEGEVNGVVKVKVEFKETGKEPAVEDTNYIVTSKELTINAEEKQGAIEVLLYDNDIIEKTGGRTFAVKIVEAKGASIDAEKAECVVTLKDNDANFYERLAGKWTGKMAAGDIKVNIQAYPEGHVLYDKQLVLVLEEPKNGIPCNFTLNYSYDKETKKIELSTPLGEVVAEGLDFGGNIGVGFIVSSIFNGNDVQVEGEIKWTLSEDMKTITPQLGEKEGISGIIFNEAGFTGYLFFAYPGLVLTK